MPEINRAEIDLAGDSLRKHRVFRIVDLASDDVHGKPRHPQLFMTGGIELGKLGDRRHLTQKPQSIEAPLLERARQPRQLGGPTDLSLNLVNELADLGCGGLGLFVLNAEQRGLIFLIGEPDLKHPVGDKRDKDHRKKQSDVF